MSSSLPLSFLNHKPASLALSSHAGHILLPLELTSGVQSWGDKGCLGHPFYLSGVGDMAEVDKEDSSPPWGSSSEGSPLGDVLVSGVAPALFKACHREVLLLQVSLLSF